MNGGGWPGPPGLARPASGGGRQELGRCPAAPQGHRSRPRSLRATAAGASDGCSARVSPGSALGCTANRPEAQQPKTASIFRLGLTVSRPRPRSQASWSPDEAAGGGGGPAPSGLGAWGAGPQTPSEGLSKGGCHRGAGFPRSRKGLRRLVTWSSSVPQTRHPVRPPRAACHPAIPRSCFQISPVALPRAGRTNTLCPPTSKLPVADFKRKGSSVLFRNFSLRPCTKRQHHPRPGPVLFRNSSVKAAFQQLVVQGALRFPVDARRRLVDERPFRRRGPSGALPAGWLGAGGGGGR